jgi:hypothetical protein
VAKLIERFGKEGREWVDAADDEGSLKKPSEEPLKVWVVDMLWAYPKAVEGKRGGSTFHAMHPTIHLAMVAFMFTWRSSNVHLAIVALRWFAHFPTAATWGLSWNSAQFNPGGAVKLPHDLDKEWRHIVWEPIKGAKCQLIEGPSIPSVPDVSFDFVDIFDKKENAKLGKVAPPSASKSSGRVFIIERPRACGVSRPILAN